MSKKQNKKKAKKQEVQKAGFGGLASGAALAGAGAMIYDKNSGQNFAQFETPDGHVVSILVDTDNNGIYDTEFIRATPIPEEEQDEEVVVIQAETVIVSEEGQSFSEAFNDARNELGAGGIFEWNGHQYNTFIAEEWQDMSEEQHNEWAALPDDEKQEYYDNIDDADELDVNDPIATNNNIDDDNNDVDDNNNDVDDDNNDVDDEYFDDDTDNQFAEEEFINDDDDYDNDDASDWKIV